MTKDFMYFNGRHVKVEYIPGGDAYDVHVKSTDGRLISFDLKHKDIEDFSGGSVDYLSEILLFREKTNGLNQRDYRRIHKAIKKTRKRHDSQNKRLGKGSNLSGLLLQLRNRTKFA